MKSKHPSVLTVNYSIQMTCRNRDLACQKWHDPFLLFFRAQDIRPGFLLTIGAGYDND